ncbi:MAG: flagellar biosynthetic protein FliR [Oscillospiraceae bacterium]
MFLDYDFTLLFMIFLRMSGCVLFNPIFGRKNIPPLVKVSLGIVFTLFVYNSVSIEPIVINNITVFIVTGVKELLVGFIIGFIMNLFLSTLIISGDLMDMQMGISMSKIYDPSSNVSMPLSASLVNAMMIVLFFLTNSHHTLIKIFMYSATAVPVGNFEINPDVFKQLALMLSQILVYSVKLAMPILAAELITEIGVGIMMKAVPQINVFVVNIQLKILIGFVLMLILAVPFANFTDRLFTLMFENINKTLLMLNSG